VVVVAATLDLVIAVALVLGGVEALAEAEPTVGGVAALDVAAVVVAVFVVAAAAFETLADADVV